MRKERTLQNDETSDFCEFKLNEPSKLFVKQNVVHCVSFKTNRKTSEINKYCFIFLRMITSVNKNSRKHNEASINKEKLLPLVFVFPLVQVRLSQNLDSLFSDKFTDTMSFGSRKKKLCELQHRYAMPF